MAKNAIRKDRFTAQEGDFVLEPAPKKSSSGSKSGSGKSGSSKGSAPAKGKK